MRWEPALGLDPGDSQALRGFVGIELNRDPVPDELCAEVGDGLRG
jgi:hypothetical protein